MSMVCPQCNATFDQRLHCPGCGARLAFHESVRAPGGTEIVSSNSWLHTPAGRIVVGLLVSQGLFFCLQYLGNALLLSFYDPANAAQAWGTGLGLVLLQVIQVLSLLVGGALAGASQRAGMLYGAVIGAMSGVIFLVFAPTQAQLMHPYALYAQPVIQTAFGALGGVVGCLIWKPPANLSLLALGRPKLVRPVRRAPLAIFVGPIVWWRVVVGTLIGTAGVLTAGLILDNVLYYSSGKLKVSTNEEASLITWEIASLLVLFGSALAGANTRNGLKQGFCVGVGIAVLLIGSALGGTRFYPNKLLLDVMSSIALALAGGWFGGVLFPYIPPHARGRRRIGPTP